MFFSVCCLNSHCDFTLTFRCDIKKKCNNNALRFDYTVFLCYGIYRANDIDDINYAAFNRVRRCFSKVLPKKV